MSQFTNELCGIAAEIANGTYTRKDVKNKLDTLERAYPEETYMVYPVARKEKPWNRICHHSCDRPCQENLTSLDRKLH